LTVTVETLRITDFILQYSLFIAIHIGAWSVAFFLYGCIEVVFFFMPPVLNSHL
jgi:hypothetical protein